MEISKFMSEMFGQVDVFTDENGEIWFSGNQVAEALGYDKSNLANAVRRFTEEEDRKALKYKASLDSNEAVLWTKANDYSDKLIINEPGLYSMVASSRLPKAKEFKHWVTHEVLPSIRKHGAYINRQEELDPDQLATVTAEAESLAKEVERLADQNAVLKDKNAFLQKRRHELIKERDAIKAKKIYLSGESEKRGDCIDRLLKMLDRAYSDYNELEETTRFLNPSYRSVMLDIRKRKEEKEAKAFYRGPEGPEMTVTVANDGTVIRIN